MLQTAFYESRNYRELARGSDFRFVVGRRGSGKSALFKKVTEALERDSVPGSINTRTYMKWLHLPARGMLAFGEAETHAAYKPILNHSRQSHTRQTGGARAHIYVTV